ncbi:diguanylate cyclase [Vibrio sp. HN007]|uniref:diguanylate cyclase n=1 Tax=Vibrio iocasae TaxID=3098914 RepID=UPI0035D49446
MGTETNIYQRNAGYLSQIASATPAHIFVATESGVCVDVFEDSERPFPIEQSVWIGKSIYDIHDKKTANNILSTAKEAILHNKPQTLRYSFRLKDFYIYPKEKRTDEMVWYEGKAIPINCTHQGNLLVIWVAKNITEQRMRTCQLEALIETDELTGAMNRRAFFNRLNEAYQVYKRHKQKTCVLMLDIDNFKAINDGLGHLTGDEVLKHIARVGQTQLREFDCFARIGGEEFAVISLQTDENQAFKLGERIRKSIEDAPFYFQNETFIVTASVGVATFDSSDDIATHILRRADNAMYQSKQAGKNKVTLYQPMPFQKNRDELSREPT